MTQLVESRWKPIQVENRKGIDGYKISSYSISSSWYNRQVANDGTRLSRLNNYNNADEQSVEISRALDVLAEDISSCNADDEKPLYVEFENEDKTKKSTISIANETLRLWLKRTDFEGKLFDRVRKTLKYGATFYRRRSDGSLVELFPERIVGYVTSHESDDEVTHYLYDKNVPRIESCGISANDFQSTSNRANTNKTEVEKIHVDDLVVLKIGDKPLGESIVQKVYGLWKIMKMIEDSIVVYRVTRSHERIIYYIDVGNLQGPKREAVIERQRLRLQQKKVLSGGGKLSTEYDPNSLGEDIFIPTNSTGKGSRVESLQSGMNLGEINDLEWFRMKLAAGLRIPSSMIDINEQGQQNQHTDMRIGQIYQIEMRYMGHVKRLKRGLVPALERDWREFGKRRNVVIPEECSLVINDSMSFVEYKEMELQQSLLNVMNSSLQLGQISKKFALQKFMQMDVEEIRENERMVLAEKGLNEEQVKELDQTIIDNIVYGDGRLGADLGVPESSGQGW